MANEFFENPKVALGFAGVVVAVALVASVAFKEFSPSEEETVESLVAEETTSRAATAAANPSNVSSAAVGWGDSGSASDDWGAPVSAAQNGGFSEAPEQTNDMPVYSDHVSKSIADRGPRTAGSPIITSSAAPGAPEVRPPDAGPQPEIVAKGN